MIFSITVSATKWVELKPQEVVDRAEVIVIGKYNFSSKPIKSSLLFQGYDFNVSNAYKGDTSKKIIVGINENDTGWAEEYQDEGGEFLLFLEESEDAKFLVPVAGPNGMIQISNGKVDEPNNERKTFFEDFLKTSPEKAIRTTMEPANEKSKTNLLLYSSAIMLIVFTILFLLLRYRRKK